MSSVEVRAMYREMTEKLEEAFSIPQYSYQPDNSRIKRAGPVENILCLSHQ